MFRIIFPDDDEIPSPYYDVVDDSAKCLLKSADHVAEYGNFLRRELPPLVRRELEVILEGELEERLRDRIVGVVQGLHTRLHEAFLRSLQDDRTEDHDRTGDAEAQPQTAVAGPSSLTRQTSQPFLGETTDVMDNRDSAAAMALDELLQGDYIHTCPTQGLDYIEDSMFNDIT
ncbi:hypothetical protein B0H63DRAFT_181688 [Podospora didyma]|uniref:Uncharacterized protein n=1 Tax=Podospora didyma TaxID=330526 RepID=A0AAE0NPJ2_9PEZI|nr:hypothetical protein B0H63DRAFT_181688 [Podospora didyma]